MTTTTATTTPPARCSWTRTASVRRPGQQTRCPGCGAVVTVDRNGKLATHQPEGVT
jgi:hypothetical protein